MHQVCNPACMRHEWDSMSPSRILSVSAKFSSWPCFARTHAAPPELQASHGQLSQLKRTLAHPACLSDGDAGRACMTRPQAHRLIKVVCPHGDSRTPASILCCCLVSLALGQCCLRLHKHSTGLEHKAQAQIL